MDPARRPTRRPIVRRDAEGGERTAPSWDSLVERLIREAQDDGRFDDLPGTGRPLRLEEDVHAGDQALAHHVLRHAGIAPPWIEADKEVRRLAERIEATLVEAARAGAMARGRLAARLDTLAQAHDEAVARLAILAPSPRQHRRPLDRARLTSRLEDALERPPRHDGA